ncbi:CG6617 [Drosophila busckii]|uniref:CG6617 n=1 Tax=Drosophila busckii TaxID=30019 RepID=A0A0M4F932_DROBS|nr:glucose-induced degradation protein 8-A homolog [Drosophila busckii]ALC48645.1 CG6617 [Drosophila busckii]
MSFKENCEAVSKEEWQQKLDMFPFKQSDMNRLVMNYLVTEGFKEAAEKFKLEADLEPNVELSSLDDRILIREAVQDGRIEEATQLVNQLHPTLLNSERYLYFHLQQLQLIELIRAGKVKEALNFAQNKLSESGDEAIYELERTLALLAFEKPQESPFADLLEQSYRQKIASELNAAILRCEHNEESTPKIMYLLKLILWGQSKLENRSISYPKIKDMETAQLEHKQ